MQPEADVGVATEGHMRVVAQRERTAVIQIGPDRSAAILHRAVIVQVHRAAIRGVAPAVDDAIVVDLMVVAPWWLLCARRCRCLRWLHRECARRRWRTGGWHRQRTGCCWRTGCWCIANQANVVGIEGGVCATTAVAPAHALEANGVAKITQGKLVVAPAVGLGRYIWLERRNRIVAAILDKEAHRLAASAAPMQPEADVGVATEGHMRVVAQRERTCVI